MIAKGHEFSPLPNPVQVHFGLISFSLSFELIIPLTGAE